MQKLQCVLILKFYGTKHCLLKYGTSRNLMSSNEKYSRYQCVQWLGWLRIPYLSLNTGTHTSCQQLNTASHQNLMQCLAHKLSVKEWTNMVTIQCYLEKNKQKSEVLEILILDTGKKEFLFQFRGTLGHWYPVREKVAQHQALTLSITFLPVQHVSLHLNLLSCLHK